MSSSKIVIPERKSSEFALEEQSLRLKKSRAELKRRMLSTSFESSPTEFRNLKIEDLEAEAEERMLHKSWLDMEYSERKLTKTKYIAAYRNTNQRIISVGDQKWAQRQGLREEEKRLGKAIPLGPDRFSKGLDGAMVIVSKDIE